MATDAHLVDDEKTREWSMRIRDVEGDCFSMKWLKIIYFGIVYEHKFVVLDRAQWMARQNQSDQAHLGQVTDEEPLSIKEASVVGTHEDSITRVMFGMPFGLWRNPATGTEVRPLARKDINEISRQALQ